MKTKNPVLFATGLGIILLVAYFTKMFQLFDKYDSFIFPPNLQTITVDSLHAVKLQAWKTAGGKIKVVIIK